MGLCSKKKNKNLFSNLLKKIFLNIKEQTLELDFFIFLSTIIETINKILIIDIIFHSNRDYLSFHYFLYFFSPTFYSEVISNKLINGKNRLYINNEKINSKECVIMTENIYKYDQISLLLSKKLKSKVYTQNCYWNNRIFNILFIFLIVFAFYSQLFKDEKTYCKVTKKFFVYFIYLIFSSFLQTFLLIFVRPILIQVTDYYNKINIFFSFDILLLILLELFLYFYFFFFIYAYGQNEMYFFFKENLSFLILLGFHIDSFILVIRFDLKFSIIFQFFWIIIEILKQYIRIKLYIYQINRNFFLKLKYYIELYSFSFLISKSITFLISFSMNDHNFLELSELIITICFLIIFIYFSINTNLYISLTLIENNLKEKNFKGLYGIYQLFNPLYYILISINHVSKSLDRERQIYFFEIKTKLNKYFCENSSDYDLLKAISEEHVKKIFKKSYSDEVFTPNNLEKTKPVTEILFHLLKRYSKIANKEIIDYNKYAIQIITYYKIIFYFILDEKSFRCEYLLKKVLMKSFDKKNDFLTFVIFEFFIKYIRHFEKKMKDDSIEFILAFIKLNSKFFKLTKYFNAILQNTKHSRKEFSKFVFFESKKIGIQLDKIISINKKAKNISKFKNSPEYDKQKFVQSIIFHSQYDKSLETFDFSSIDSLVDRNNYFVLLFDKAQLIIKKAPLVFTELTKIKSTKVKNTPLINLFPLKIRTALTKIIKKTILAKQSFYLDSILETFDEYIVYVKILFSRLPSMQGNIYMLGKLEKHPNLFDKVSLIRENGVVLKIGYYYSQYLGFKPNEQENNLLSIFNLKKSIKSLEKEQFISVDYNTMFEKIRNNFKRNNGHPNGDFYRNLQVLKLRLSGRKEVQIKVNIQERYNIEGNELFLLSINFEDILHFLNKTKIVSEVTVISSNKNNFENSHSSNDSEKKNNDSSWSVASHSKDHIVETNNQFDNIGIFYNIFLVFFAIALCIFLKIKSDNFYQGYLDLFILREMNSDYFYNQFFICQKIVLENSGNKKDQLEELLLSIYNISFDFKSYYDIRMKNESNYIINIYNTQFKKFIENQNSGKIYQIARKKFNIIEYNGKPVETNYLDGYIIPLNYFYILSQNDDFYIEVPIINYNEPLKINNLNSTEHQYLMTFPFNIFPFVLKTNEINYTGKEIFISTFRNFRFMIILLMILNIIFNIISLVILYLSVNYSNKRMLKIEEKVQNLESAHKNFLHKKIRIVKRIIINELKATVGLEHLKKFSEEINKNNINDNNKTNILLNKKTTQNKMLYPGQTFKEKANNFNLEHLNVLISNKKRGDFSSSVFIPNKKILNTPSIKPRQSISQNSKKGYRASQILYDFANEGDNLKNKFEEENITRQFNKNDKYVDHVTKNVIQVIFYFSIIYIIYSIFSISLINQSLNTINLKRIEIENCDDLQDGLLKYYLIGKYSILLNTTEIINYFDYFGNFSNLIYKNLTSLMNYIYIENEKEYIKDLLDSNDKACENYLTQDDFYETIIQICHTFPLFTARIITVLSSYLKNIKGEVYNFIQSNRSKESIIQSFHSIQFQINNIIEIVYFMDFMCLLEYDHLLPQFKASIDNLNYTLVVLFIVLVIIDFFNYLEGNFIILKDLDNTLNNYGIIEKFFIPVSKEKNKTK